MVPSSIHPEQDWAVIFRMRFLRPKACISAMDGISITEAEFVTAEGNRTRGRAIPVKIP